MLLRRIAITPRAVIGFAILASLLVALGLFAHNRMGSLNRAAKDIGEVWLPSVEASAQLSGLMSELRLGEMNHVLLHDATRMRQQEQRMDEVIATLARVEREYRPLLVLDEERALLDQFVQRQQEYLEGHAALLALSRDNRTDEASVLMGGAQLQRYEQVQRTLKQLIALDREAARASTAEAADVYSRASTAILAVLLVALAASVTIAWLLTRSIVVPIRQAVSCADRIAARDLTGEIASDGDDEPAQLMKAMRSMQASLHDTIEQIGDSAALLAAAAEQLNAVTEEGNRSLARQNDEIEMAATAVNEMSAAVEEFARNASSTAEASSLSERAAGNARQMLDEAEAADHALGEIAEHATRINERTLVIASAAEEQAHVAREVDRNLVNIRDVAVQTTQGAEQTRGASHELSRLANDLKGMIGRFVV